MKILFSIIFIFSIIYAENFMSAGDILKTNNKIHGAESFWLKSECEKIKKETCYKIDNKDPRYYSVVGGNLVLNQTLKDAYDAEQALKESNNQTSLLKEQERIVDLKLCIDQLKAGTITNNQKDQCLLKVIKQTIKNSLTISDL